MIANLFKRIVRSKNANAHKSTRRYFGGFLDSLAEGVGVNIVESSSNGNF